MPPYYTRVWGYAPVKSSPPSARRARSGSRKELSTGPRGVGAPGSAPPGWARLSPSGSGAATARRPGLRPRRAASSSSSSSEHAWSSIVADGSPAAAKRAGTVARVRSPGSTSATSSHSSGHDTRPSALLRTEYAGGHGAVAGVLVVVDEHPLAALLLPPLRRGERRHLALDGPGQRQRGAPHLGEVPPRLDADVHVDPARARGLREADEPCASRTSWTTPATSRTVAKGTPGWGSRSTRSSSGWSTSARRTGHGLRSRQPRFTAQTMWATSTGQSSSAERPLGNVT